MNEENATGTLLKLEKLADYQDHAIVSRILLKKKMGSVTLFAFDQEVKRNVRYP